VCSCPDGGAHLVAAHVRRGLFATVTDGADVVTGAGTYRLHHTAAGADPTQALSLAVQRAMAETELLAAAQARADHGVPDDLLVVDGPLPQRQHLDRAVGFVKTHKSAYLPAELNGIVAALRTGQRTPVFTRGSTFKVHTWYLRLPCPPGSPWAGVARVECSGQLAPVAAVLLAATSQAVLVRFASTQYKDARAPQNLYPIAGLERELRRRLGDPKLLYRALRRAAA
jgi:hypothetical protein